MIYVICDCMRCSSRYRFYIGCFPFKYYIHELVSLIQFMYELVLLVGYRVDLCVCVGWPTL